MDTGRSGISGPRSCTLFARGWLLVVDELDARCTDLTKATRGLFNSSANRKNCPADLLH